MSTNYYKDSSDKYPKKTPNLERLEYFCKQAHAIIKPYYFYNQNKRYKPSGEPKNGTIFKYETNIYCLANIKDLLLPIIDKSDINYKNAEILEHLTPNTLSVDVNYFNKTFISSLHYTTAGGNEYMIIITYHSIEIFLLHQGKLKKVYRHIFCYDCLIRKCDLYNDYLYTTSKEGITIISLSNIDTSLDDNDKKVDIILENTYCADCSKPIYTGLNINVEKGLLSIYNDTDFYIYSIESDSLNPVFQYRRTLSNIESIIYNKFNSGTLNIISYPVNKDLDTILITTTSNHYVVDISDKNHIRFIGISEGYNSQLQFKQLVAINSRLFVSISQQTMANKTPKLDLFVLESKNIVCNDLDLTTTEKGLVLSYTNTIILEGESLVSKVIYDSPHLYLLNCTNGIIKYMVNMNGLTNFSVSNIHEVDCFLYFKDLVDYGAMNVTITNNTYYLLDSCNGIIIYKESPSNQSTKQLTYDTLVYETSSELIKIPDKIFIHLNTSDKSFSCNYDTIDFESTIVSIDRQTQLALLYVPYYTLCKIKPPSITCPIYPITSDIYSYGIGDKDMKRYMSNVNILNLDVNVFTPKYYDNIVINCNKFGPDISASPFISGSLAMNTNGTPITYLSNESSKGIYLSVINNFYKYFVDELSKRHSVEFDFKTFGICPNSSLIVRELEKTKCGINIVNYTIDNRPIYITSKENIPNFKSDVVYRVMTNTNCLLGFTRIRKYEDIYLEINDIGSPFLCDEYIFLDMFYKNEDDMLRDMHYYNPGGLKRGVLTLIEEPVVYRNDMLHINPDRLKLMTLNYYLNIDVVSIELLNTSDLETNIILKLGNKFKAADFIKYKQMQKTGYLILDTSMDFIKVNYCKLKPGDIINRVDNECSILPQILHKPYITVEYFRLINCIWERKTTKIETLVYKSCYNNLII